MSNADDNPLKDAEVDTNYYPSSSGLKVTFTTGNEEKGNKMKDIIKKPFTEHYLYQFEGYEEDGDDLELIPELYDECTSSDYYAKDYHTDYAAMVAQVKEYFTDKVIEDLLEASINKDGTELSMGDNLMQEAVDEQIKVFSKGMKEVLRPVFPNSGVAFFTEEYLSEWGGYEDCPGDTAKYDEFCFITHKDGIEDAYYERRDYIYYDAMLEQVRRYFMNRPAIEEIDREGKEAEDKHFMKNVSKILSPNPLEEYVEAKNSLGVDDFEKTSRKEPQTYFGVVGRDH